MDANTHDPRPDGPGPGPLDLARLSPAERGELLCAYLDGELSDERAREVTTWLEGRPEALAEAERQRRLWDLLGRYADEPVPEGFAARVLHEVGASGRPALRAQPPSRWLRRPRLLAAAATLLAALGAGALWLAHGGEVAPVAGVQLAALESIDADFVQHADLGEVLSLSDAQFEALLVAEPSALVGDSLGG